MTTNQAKLAVQMSSCYGAPLSPRRAAELVGVVGAGVAYRSCARSVAGLLPGIGNLLKAGIAFGGTMATARGREGQPRGLVAGRTPSAGPPGPRRALLASDGGAASRRGWAVRRRAHRVPGDRP